VYGIAIRNKVVRKRREREQVRCQNINGMNRFLISLALNFLYFFHQLLKVIINEK